MEPCSRVLEIVVDVMGRDDEASHLETLTEGALRLGDLGYDEGTREEVKNGMAYLRDRVGVPRDMPLVAARELRGHLNWVIEVM